MIFYEDNCVSCGLICVPYCPYYNPQRVCICDKCEKYLDIYYEIDDNDLCQAHAIEYIKQNIKDFEHEYGKLSSDEDIIELLEHQFKKIFEY